jgi:hypothetical protein
VGGREGRVYPCGVFCTLGSFLGDGRMVSRDDEEWVRSERGDERENVTGHEKYLLCASGVR